MTTSTTLTRPAVLTRSRVLHASLWAWALGSLVVISSLMAGHWLTLPRPASGDARLATALASLRGAGDQQAWLAVHALYAECRCSQDIVEHLIARGPSTHAREVVLLAGEDGELAARARAAGYRVEAIEAAQLGARYHITAAPLFVVVDPDDDVRYAGGYTSRKQGPDPQDAAILTSLTQNGQASALPLFGCAVSKRLQALLDPFGLKYGS
jgi:hypothetical protein